MTAIHSILVFLACLIFSMAVANILLFFGLVARTLFWPLRDTLDMTGEERTKIWLLRTRRLFRVLWFSMLAILVLMFINAGLHRLL